VTSVTKPRHVPCWNSTWRAMIGRPGHVFGGCRQEQSSVLPIRKWSYRRSVIKSNKVRRGEGWERRRLLPNMAYVLCTSEARVLLLV
jgi:hypothetical protein